MTPESHIIADWVDHERQADFGWICENLDLFWSAAVLAFEDTGRGAIVVDITSLPLPGIGHRFGYFSQELVEECGDEDTRRMVAEYDPGQELVLVLLKPSDRSSTYRIGTHATPTEEPSASEARFVHTGESETRAKLEAPEIETLIAWEAEGGCEAACPDHCWVEPDGVCPHGKPSWFLHLGLI